MNSKNLKFYFFDSENCWGYFFLRCLTYFLLPFLFACAQVIDFQNASAGQFSKKAYSPNVDLYVFRSPIRGVASWQMGFHVPGVNNIANYLLQFFSDGESSINSFQGKNDMLFHASKIRIFYVTARSSATGSVATTYADQLRVQRNNIRCPTASGGLMPVRLGLRGLNAANVFRRGEFEYHMGDLITAGYQVFLGLPQRRLYMTNEAGTNLTGPEIQVKPNHVRIFFADIISPCEGAAGLATMGNTALLSSQKDRVMGYAAIAGRYNNPENIRDKTTSFLTNLKTTISHEFGHFFGLRHPFASSIKSCKFAPMGTTRRIMDYGSGLDQFIPCEREIHRVGSSHFLDGKITTYKFSDDGRLLSPLVATRGVQSTSLYRGLSTDNQLLAEFNRLHIYDADYHSHEAQKNASQKVSREEISREKIFDLEIVR